MTTIAIVLFLLVVVTGLAEIASSIKIPYPILLVLVGIGIGLIPHLPMIKLDPEVVFLIFLPPVLYAAAWATSWPDFKAAKRPISLLAIGCVLFSTCAVAWVAHTFIPGFNWAEAFVLGAIISPPDAVAATAATKGLGVPRRVVTILEGESLVNDATGLIAYKYAIAAVVSGSFVLWEAGLQFMWVASAGIAVGLITGQLFLWIHRITPDNPTTDTTLTFLAPYIAYLSAEAFHLSGVLAVVTAGLFLAWHSTEVFPQQTRLQATGTWNTVLFILNGLIFIFIGLQLPFILNSMHEYSIWELLAYGAIVSATVIIGRIIWVYPGTYIPRILSKRIRTNEPKPSLKLVTVVAWSGMRGIVSLAAALALPLTINGTEKFPNRNMILFITFSVIFATLVLQGLTMPSLIKMLGIKPDGREHDEEQEARMRIASSVIEHIEENYSLLPDEVLNQVKTKYEIRIQRLRKDVQRKMDDAQFLEFQRIQQELIDRERKFIVKLRNEGTISIEVLRRLEYELDLEETRLILERA